MLPHLFDSTPTLCSSVLTHMQNVGQATPSKRQRNGNRPFLPPHKPLADFTSDSTQLVLKLMPDAGQATPTKRIGSNYKSSTPPS